MKNFYNQEWVNQYDLENNGQKRNNLVKPFIQGMPLKLFSKLGQRFAF